MYKANDCWKIISLFNGGGGGGTESNKFRCRKLYKSDIQTRLILIYSRADQSEDYPLRVVMCNLMIRTRGSALFY